jgi:periplasmic protein CpxP/Spy
MTKSKYFRVFAVTAILVVLAAIGVSQTVRHAHMRRAGMFDGMGGPMLGYYAHKLELTDAQRTQVKGIMAKEKPTFQPLMLQMAQSHQQMQQLLMSSGFDEAKVRELATQQTQAMTELMVQRARVESEMLQVLTPDQKTKLTALAAAHQQRLIEHLQKPAQGQTPSQ